MLKSKRGITGVDAIIAIIAIMIFTSTILALMYNVKMENLKIKAKALASVYMTEILENIGITEYDEVTSENIELIPQMPEALNAKINVSKIIEEDNTKTEDILKKVTVTISYKIGNKTYQETTQRLKTKE